MTEGVPTSDFCTNSCGNAMSQDWMPSIEQVFSSLSKSGYKEQEIISVYAYGSPVYGTNRLPKARHFLSNSIMIKRMDIVCDVDLLVVVEEVHQQDMEFHVKQLEYSLKHSKSIQKDDDMGDKMVQLSFDITIKSPEIKKDVVKMDCNLVGRRDFCENVQNFSPILMECISLHLNTKYQQFILFQNQKNPLVSLSIPSSTTATNDSITTTMTISSSVDVDKSKHNIKDGDNKDDNDAKKSKYQIQGGEIKISNQKINEVERESLRRSFSSKSNHSFSKALKKLCTEHDYYVGLKSLFHSIRICMFGVQIATNGYVVDYSCANHFYQEIMSDFDKVLDELEKMPMNELHQQDRSKFEEELGKKLENFFRKKYKPTWNSFKTEFRKVAPKKAPEETKNKKKHLKNNKQ